MTTTLATKRAVGYLRVSSTGQIGKRHSSLETQEARYYEHCSLNHCIPQITFMDVVSGRRDDRREYNRMLDFVRAGNADVIVVQYLDRFGRNPKEILRRYWELQEMGVSIVATDEDIEDELLLLIKAGMAGAESKRTSERVRANMARVVQKGVHAGRPPFGYLRVYEGRDYHWEQEPTEALIVREMYRLAVEENLGHKAIADRLLEKGYKGREGGLFASHTVNHILNNEALVGTLAYGKKPKKGNPPQEIIRVPDFFPAILTQEEWTRLQERLSIRREASRGRTHASDYLLSGTLKCGHCGGPMVGKVGAKRSGGGRYRSYWCGRARQGRAFCRFYNGHSVARLEKAVLDYLSQFSDPELVRQHMEAAERKEIESKEVEFREVTRSLSDLEGQFLKHLDLIKRGILNEEEFIKANESIRSRKEAVEARQMELKQWLEDQQGKVSASERMPQAIGSFVEDFGKLEVRAAKAQLQTMLKAIYVSRDNTIEMEFRS